MASETGNAEDVVKVTFTTIHEMVEAALAKMQDLAASLQSNDEFHDFESGAKEDCSARSFPEAQIRPISGNSQLTSCRTFTEEHKDNDAACLMTRDAFEDHLADDSCDDEHFVRASEEDVDRNSISTASSLFNIPHRSWEVDIFLKDAELSVEKRMGKHEDGTLIEQWIGGLKVQRLKLIATQRETAMEGRRGIEAVRKVQERLVQIEAAFSQSQKREPITIDALAAVKEELVLLQDTYRKCAIEKNALDVQMARDYESRAEESQKFNAAVDSLIVRHKAEVSSLQLEIVRMKNSNERKTAALKDELNNVLENRIPKDQMQQMEKQNKTLRIAAEEAKKESLAAFSALSAERQSRLEEMQHNDRNELRAQQNITLWQSRCRQLDSSLKTVMTAYERANLDWPFDEHYQIIDPSKDPKIVVALPPTPAMLALAAEKQNAQNHMFELERENGELRFENERLHANYAASIIQNDEDRLKIDSLNTEIKKVTVDKDTLQKKTKSALAIAQAKANKVTSPKVAPAVVESSSVESQTEEINRQGNELKEFENNQRLQSVAGLMLRQLGSRSETNRVLQKSIENAASGLNKSVIEWRYIHHEILQFMARVQNIMEGLVHQNTQLKEIAAGERSVLQQRLQQALSSNDNMRREIDYLKCMSSNIFCEITDDDLTLGPLMHQHSVSIQTDIDSHRSADFEVQSHMQINDGEKSNTRQQAAGKPVIPSRKTMMSKEMLLMRSSMMAWMASTVSKTFFAWKNVVWFGACAQSPLLEGSTMIVEIQKCKAHIEQQFTDAIEEIQSSCKIWCSSLSAVADMIAKEKAVKDLGDNFFTNRSQIQLMMSLSEQVTSLQYQNSFQTLQEGLMDDQKEILLSVRRSEETALELKNEIVCLKTRNLEMLEDLDSLSNLVEELKKKLEEEETRQLEWSTHVEATAGVWAQELVKLVEQDKALFDQNEILRKLLIESMGNVKSPLPQLVAFENLSINVGASSLCSCHGCKKIRKRLQVIQSAALNVTAKFVSKKQAVFKGADAFLKGQPVRKEETLDKTTKTVVTSPKMQDEESAGIDHDAVNALHSNGAQRTMLRVLKYQVRITKLESENARLQGKIDELQLLNDYLRTKVRNQTDMNNDRPITGGRLVNSAHSVTSSNSSRQLTPRTPMQTSPVKPCFQEDNLAIETTTINPGTVSRKSAQTETFQAVANGHAVNHSVPRLIKSAGGKQHENGDSSLTQTQNLDFMLDAAHRRIDEMNREIIELRQQTQEFDKKSVADSIERAVKMSTLRMMTQVELLIAQASDLKKELTEKEKQTKLEEQKVAAEFKAQQLLLSRQLSSARMEMSRRVGKSIELRQNYESVLAASRSYETALKKLEQSRDMDRKIIQELKDQLSQQQIAEAISSEQIYESSIRIRDEIVVEIDARESISMSEKERELLGQLVASEHIADAAVALSHHLVRVLEQTVGNGNSAQNAAADAFKKAKTLGIELPFLAKGPWHKATSLISEHVDVNLSIDKEKEDVSNRQSPRVPRDPMHRSDNALSLLKLVDSDFEDMHLVKSAMKRIQLRPFEGLTQQSPRNPVSARILRPSKQTSDKSIRPKRACVSFLIRYLAVAAKPRPPPMYLREAPVFF